MLLIVFLSDEKKLQLDDSFTILITAVAYSNTIKPEVKLQLFTALKNKIHLFSSTVKFALIDAVLASEDEIGISQVKAFLSFFAQNDPDIDIQEYAQSELNNYTN